jgi:hypothetical protein
MDSIRLRRQPFVVMMRSTNVRELDHDTAIGAGGVLGAELDKPYPATGACANRRYPTADERGT